jgi:[ribosomal protein S5]-alanine N-acetyltransferase
MFELQTERLILRHFSSADDEALYKAIFNDPEVMRFSDGIQSLEWTHAWIQHCQQDYYEAKGYGPFAVIERSARRLIGYCGLFYFSEVNGQPEIELGYRLARSAWGRGYATEAAIAVRDYAFTTLGIKRLVSIIDPSNIASIRVAEKLGMRFEAEVMFEGYSHPDHVYAINYTE